MLAIVFYTATLVERESHMKLVSSCPSVTESVSFGEPRYGSVACSNQLVLLVYLSEGEGFSQSEAACLPAD